MPVTNDRQLSTLSARVMNSNDPTVSFSRGLSAQKRMHEKCEQFIAVWKDHLRGAGAGPPDIQAYLDCYPDGQRADLFRDLLDADVFYRRKHGEQPMPRDYFTRFPHMTDIVDEFFGGTSIKRDENQSPIATNELEVSQPESIGRYAVERKLGGGAFGNVYLAFDQEAQRHVADKVPKTDRVSTSEDIDAYITEARIVANLDHPHIVPVFDVGRTEREGCFVVFKHIEGANLKDMIRDNRRSDVDGHDAWFMRSAEIVEELAGALHHAHKEGLVHRDVKPANILIDGAGKAYITDFGIALREDDFGESDSFVGTPLYMSPEQARGEGHLVDGRSDIYSLGTVFYELLTGRPPFQGGVKDVLRRIASGEVKPPRMRDERIPKELERICLTALASQITDRYTTAHDMADDLRHFLSAGQSTFREPSEIPHSSVGPQLPVIVPKGLLSFDGDDADFFLDLLPGPRDRQGLPDVVSFWKRRIEDREDTHAFRVGLIQGPSGCGKSSLVRAGIIPRLNNRVKSIVIDCDDNTVDQITRRVRRICHQMDDSQSMESLPQLLRRIRKGDGFVRDQKLLIVLDQFEQYLQLHYSPTNDVLVEALRQCNGSQVQCLIIARVDFALAVDRFLRQVEIHLARGTNEDLVDLFDTLHARKVLIDFGRAYGRLPPDSQPLHKEHCQFVDDAITGLSDQDDRIVPIHLSVFADMVKGKSWVADTLRSIGGVQGIGVKFLEDTFARDKGNPRAFRHRDAAQTFLRALLPKSGTIKRQTRSQSQLAAACNLKEDSSEFLDLVALLDRDARLIRPVENEYSNSQTSDAGMHYQLTHDYLVPSLRQWLDSRGSAYRRLEELSAAWEAKPEKRNLPTLWELVQICLRTKRRLWSQAERAVVRKAFSLLFRQAVFGLLIAGIISAIIYGYWVKGLVKSLANVPVQQLGALLDRLQPHSTMGSYHVGVELARIPRDDLDDVGWRFQLAKLAWHPETVRDSLIESLLSANVDESQKFKIVLSGLSKHDPDGALTVTHIIKDEVLKILKELRVMQEQLHSEETTLRVAQQKINEECHKAANLAIAAKRLGDDRLVADILNYRISGDKKSLVEIGTWMTYQFARLDFDPKMLIETIRDPATTEDVCFALLVAISEYETDKLLVVEAKDVAAQILRMNPDGGVRAAAEHLLAQLGWDVEALNIGDNASKTEIESGNRRTVWKRTANNHLMIKLGPIDFYMGSFSYDPHHSNDEKRKQIELDRVVAFSSKEVTIKQFDEFSQDVFGMPYHEWFRMNDPSYAANRSRYDDVIAQLRPRHPRILINAQLAMHYCNWMSVRDGCPDQCYDEDETKRGYSTLPRLVRKPLSHELDGYRLPAEEEWEFACRAGTDTIWHFGNDSNRLADYAVFASNSEDQPFPVGTFRPNRNGLFDMHGNASEYCSYTDSGTGLTEYQLRGGGFSSAAYLTRSAHRALGTSSQAGFRIVRTVKGE